MRDWQSPRPTAVRVPVLRNDLICRSAENVTTQHSSSSEHTPSVMPSKRQRETPMVVMEVGQSAVFFALSRWLTGP